MIFLQNIIPGGVVFFLNTDPATPVSAPVPSKMSVLSGVMGGAKLGWLRRLKISARNWTLKFSEILLMWLFLNTEKSNPVMPGLIKILRPALPRRLKQARGGSQGA